MKRKNWIWSQFLLPVTIAATFELLFISSISNWLYRSTRYIAACSGHQYLSLIVGPFYQHLNPSCDYWIQSSLLGGYHFHQPLKHNDVPWSQRVAWVDLSGSLRPLFFSQWEWGMNPSISSTDCPHWPLAQLGTLVISSHSTRMALVVLCVYFLF